MDSVFKIESLEVFQDVSQHILTNLYYTGSTCLSSHIDAELVALAKQNLISIISDCNFNVSKIIEIFESKEWNPEKIECFRTLLEKNKSEVLFAAFNHYNSSYCETVTHFDWLVKYVLGTSEMKTLKFPLLQLIMFTFNKNVKQHKIMYDVNKENLLKMINALEKLK